MHYFFYLWKYAPLLLPSINDWFFQVAGPYGLPPTPARRALFIVYQSAVPYIAERVRCSLFSFLILELLLFIIFIVFNQLDVLGSCTSVIFFICVVCSSRIASRGIALTDSLSDDLYGENALASSQVQPPAVVEAPTSSAPGASFSVLSRLKEKLSGLWLYAIRRWPVVCIYWFHLQITFDFPHTLMISLFRDDSIRGQK